MLSNGKGVVHGLSISLSVTKRDRCPTGQFHTPGSAGVGH
jgi:hypothetical protein